MKKIYLILLLISQSFSVYCQTQIHLSFLAKDSQTQDILTLDSIFIKNITQGCDTMLIPQTANAPFSWVIQNVTWPVGIGNFKAVGSAEINMNQNYPNPFRGATYITIYKKTGGEIKLLLTDGNGRQLAVYENNLDIGFHSFEITTSAVGIFVLTGSDGKNSKSIKMIHSGEGHASTSIQYLGQNPDNAGSMLKSTEIKGFVFYLGNQMSYKAYSNGYADKTITDAPTTESTYTFGMTGLNFPVVRTFAFTNIAYSSASGGGEVTSDGGKTVTDRGVCWNKTGFPTIASSKISNGAGTGSFISNLTGLTSNTLYYVRAYATNSQGTAYGAQVSFTTTSDDLPGTVTDSRDGKIYKTVIIGKQEWMAENLEYLPAVNPPAFYSVSEPAYYVFWYEGNDVAAAKLQPLYIKYGVLYNWAAAKTACPKGWHLPSDAEWTTLIDFLGGEFPAGDKMKATTGWEGNGQGTNTSGFTGLGGGMRYSNGGFYNHERFGYWWSSTEWQTGTAYAWARIMFYNEHYVQRYAGLKEYGYSIRCVRN